MRDRTRMVDDMNDGPITRFRGEYRFLSNFWPVNIEVEIHIGTVVAMSVEHAYQSMKTTDLNRAMYIFQAPTAGQSASRGGAKKTILRRDWYEIKGQVMKSIVLAKFNQHARLMKKLKATGERYLMEGNYWHDNYWGVCSCKRCGDGPQGRNILGRILMEIRDDGS